MCEAWKGWTWFYSNSYRYVTLRYFVIFILIILGVSVSVSESLFVFCPFAIFDMHHVLSLLHCLFNLIACRNEYGTIPAQVWILWESLHPQRALRLPKVTFSSCLSAFRCLKGLRRAQWANLMCLSVNRARGHMDRRMKASLLEVRNCRDDCYQLPLSCFYDMPFVSYAS